MAKKVRLVYSSHLNITFNGTDEWDAPDDWDEMSESERDDFLRSEEEDWLWGNVDVYTEVVDVRDEG